MPSCELPYATGIALLKVLLHAGSVVVREPAAFYIGELPCVTTIGPVS